MYYLREIKYKDSKGNMSLKLFLLCNSFDELLHDIGISMSVFGDWHQDLDHCENLISVMNELNADFAMNMGDNNWHIYRNINNTIYHNIYELTGLESGIYELHKSMGFNDKLDESLGYLNLIKLTNKFKDQRLLAEMKSSSQLSRSNLPNQTKNQPVSNIACFSDEVLYILKKLVQERGLQAFDNYAKFKSFISDYFQNDYKLERRLLIQAVEGGYYKKLKNTANANERNRIKKIIIKNFKDDYGITQENAESAISALIDIVINEG